MHVDDLPSPRETTETNNNKNHTCHPQQRIKATHFAVKSLTFAARALTAAAMAASSTLAVGAPPSSSMIVVSALLRSATNKRSATQNFKRVTCWSDRKSENAAETATSPRSDSFQRAKPSTFLFCQCVYCVMFAFVAQPGPVSESFSPFSSQPFRAAPYESIGGNGGIAVYEHLRAGHAVGSGPFARPIMSGSANSSFAPQAQAFAPSARSGHGSGVAPTHGDVRGIFGTESPSELRVSRRASALAPPQHLVHRFAQPQQSPSLLRADAAAAPVFSPYARQHVAAAAPAFSPVVGSHVEVYAHNMEQALREIDALVTFGQHNFIALDTEFPGVVSASSDGQSGYDRVRNNVALTQLVQLGLSVFNADGLCAKTYQFNFCYDGVFNPASLQMLRDAGIDLDLNLTYGIDHRAFAAMFRML